MNESTEPAVITLPLSSYENMKTELAWRSKHLKTQFKEVYDTLERLKEMLLLDNLQKTVPPFDHLKTIGKYQ